MPVVRVDPRGEIPGEKLTAEIDAIEKKGELTHVIALHDEILLVWKPKQRNIEKR